jgi:hypothetical protein
VETSEPVRTKKHILFVTVLSPSTYPRLDH